LCCTLIPVENVDHENVRVGLLDRRAVTSAYACLMMMVCPYDDEADAEPMFGASLVDICTRDNSKVPQFLVSCFSQIEQRGKSGLSQFTVSASHRL